MQVPPPWCTAALNESLAGLRPSQWPAYAPCLPAVSPMADPSLDSILAGSTPRQFTLAAGLPAPLAAAAGGVPGTAAAPLLSRVSSTVSACSAAAPPMLEYPAASMGGGGDEAGEVGCAAGWPGLASAVPEALLLVACDPRLLGLCCVIYALHQLACPGVIMLNPALPPWFHHFADVLPFALDEGAPSPIKPRSPAPGAASDAAEQLPISAAPGTAPSARVAGAAAPAPAVDTDAAVGAFVRLIQEAPPLRLHSSGPPTRPGSADFAAGRAGAAAPGTSSGSDSSGATCLSDGRGLTLQAGLRQFSRIKERLRQKGIPVGPCPAEA